jgi:GNAT superfamily N-acetyltransferase
VSATIRRMRPSEAATVVHLHADLIAGAFLPKLGQRFLRQLYLAIGQDADSGVLVAARDGEILAFLAYSLDVSAMYRRLLHARWLCLAAASLPHSLHPRILRELVETACYPRRAAARDWPAAEVLSMAVIPTARRQQLGRRLMEAALEQFRRAGQTAVKALVGAPDPIHRLLRAYGFTRQGEIVQHGCTHDVYVLSVQQPLPNHPPPNSATNGSMSPNEFCP